MLLLELFRETFGCLFFVFLSQKSKSPSPELFSPLGRPLRGAVIAAQNKPPPLTHRPPSPPKARKNTKKGAKTSKSKANPSITTHTAKTGPTPGSKAKAKAKAKATPRQGEEGDSSPRPPPTGKHNNKHNKHNKHKRPAPTQGELGEGQLEIDVDPHVHFPSTRIRNIISDVTSGPVSRDAVYAVTKAAELFVEALTEASGDLVVRQKRVQLSYGDVARVVASDPRIAWLAKSVVPNRYRADEVAKELDLPAPVPAPKKPKETKANNNP